MLAKSIQKVLRNSHDKILQIVSDKCSQRKTEDIAKTALEKQLSRGSMGVARPSHSAQRTCTNSLDECLGSMIDTVVPIGT